MEEEFVRYRQANPKGKVTIARRFTKFYFREFKPITKLEAEDQDVSRMVYRCFTVLGAIGLGSLSYVWRVARMGAMGHELASRETNMVGNIIKDSCWIFAGFVTGQWYSCSTIYKQRQYVIERIRLERSLNYKGRDSFAGDTLLDEYPLKDQC